MPTLNIKEFPDELYNILGQQAKRYRRSLKAEVILLLERALMMSVKKKMSILHLKGLGKKHWKNCDPMQHVNRERESWE